MAGNKKYRDLFINAVEDIKTAKTLSYAAIARLSGIPKNKFNNIRHSKSTPEIDDILKLLRNFPHFEAHFDDIKEHITDEEPEAYASKQTLAVMQEKVDLCTKANTSYQKTIAAQKEEIKRLREIIAMQNMLLKNHGITGESESA